MKTIREQIKWLCKEEIGPNYAAEFNPEFFVQDEKHSLLVYIDGEPKEITTLEELEDEVYISGIVCGGVQNEETFNKHSFLDSSEIMRHSRIEKDDFPIMVIKLILVRTDERQRGVASTLVGMLIHRLDGVMPMMALLQERGEDKSNFRLAERFGTMEHMFHSVAPDDWYCTVCEGQCRCDSALFIRKKGDVSEYDII